MSDQTPKDVALAQAELTTARLCVNDWHACNDHDELTRWRQAQLRLIAAAQAYERVTLQEQVATLTARCEALTEDHRLVLRALRQSDERKAILASRCEALTGERDSLQAALAELVAAGEYAVSCADDVRVMLRLGQATDAARALLQG